MYINKGLWESGDICMTNIEIINPHNKKNVLNLFRTNSLKELRSKNFDKQTLIQMHKAVYGYDPLAICTATQLLEILFHSARGPKYTILKNKYKKATN